MDPAQAERFHALDPKVLGRRLKAARVSRELTQAQAGADDASVTYISRIEAGLRRPSPALLAALAARLGTTVDDLVAPDESDSSLAETELLLNYAELALATGEPTDAEGQLRSAIERLADAPVGAALARARAQVLLARALESLGRRDEAVAAAEPVAAGTGPFAIQAIIVLCRCLREDADLTRALEVGEAGLARMRDGQLEGTDDAVQLIATVASVHHESGDVGAAARLCREAVAAAEALGSAKARASAYWNASIVESHRGNVTAALPLAEKALALLGEGQDVRNLARLRGQLGILQLRDTPPQVREALENLERSTEELRECSAGPADLGRNIAALARAQLLAGDLDRAEETATEALSVVGSHSPLAEAEARAVLGQVAAHQGDTTRAEQWFTSAAHRLTAAGADRRTATLWYELGACMETVGATAQALDAYRRAAASTGLSLPAASSAVGSSAMGSLASR